MEDVRHWASPSDDELRQWFEQNPQRFALPGLVTFRHLYFSPDLRGAHARDDAADALRKLAGKPEVASELEGSPIRSCSRISTPSARPIRSPAFSGRPSCRRSPGSSRENGRDRSNPGWAGIWSSSSSTVPGRVPAFEEVEATVKSEWIDDQRAQAKRKMFDSMLARYQIVTAASRAPGDDGGRRGPRGWRAVALSRRSAECSLDFCFSAPC